MLLLILVQDIVPNQSLQPTATPALFPKSVLVWPFIAFATFRVGWRRLNSSVGHLSKKILAPFWAE
ncbi:MAG: hypothetical protein HY707_04480 [Ignavibacteriae bacterium]|nr:hypothetical protein [Ignavibacteriota bacterium]